MVRKMLKAFIKVTADKTHFARDIKSLTIIVYHLIYRYNSPELNINSYAISSFLNLFNNLLCRFSKGSNRYVRLVHIFSHYIISQTLNIYLFSYHCYCMIITTVPKKNQFYNISIYFTTLIFICSSSELSTARALCLL